MVNLYFVKFQSTTYHHLQAYVCLEEWTSGIRVSKSLEVVDTERKYNNILAGIMVAENDPYAGPILKAMYCEWWDYALWVGSPYPFFYSDISSIVANQTVLKSQRRRIHSGRHTGLRAQKQAKATQTSKRWMEFPFHQMSFLKACLYAILHPYHQHLRKVSSLSTIVCAMSFCYYLILIDL